MSGIKLDKAVMRELKAARKDARVFPLRHVHAHRQIKAIELLERDAIRLDIKHSVALTYAKKRNIEHNAQRFAERHRALAEGHAISPTDLSSDLQKLVTTNLHPIYREFGGRDLQHLLRRGLPLVAGLTQRVAGRLVNLAGVTRELVMKHWPEIKHDNDLLRDELLKESFGRRDVAVFDTAMHAVTELPPKYPKDHPSLKLGPDGTMFLGQTDPAWRTLEGLSEPLPIIGRSETRRIGESKGRTNVEEGVNVQVADLSLRGTQDYWYVGNRFWEMTYDPRKTFHAVAAPQRHAEFERATRDMKRMNARGIRGKVYGYPIEVDDHGHILAMLLMTYCEHTLAYLHGVKPRQFKLPDRFR